MQINALGQACPIPVIRAKQAIHAHPGETIEILVDNQIATENLSKMAAQLGLACACEKKDDAHFIVKISGNAENHQDKSEFEHSAKYAVVVDGDTMGKGDPVLGAKLIEGFIYALTEQDELPKYLVFYNSGVKLSCKNDKVIADLHTLIQKGVKVLSCGLCLDFYGLKEDLKAGEITNMYRIIEIMRTHRLVKP